MSRRSADLVAVSALATLIALVLAGPVLLAPSARVFGMEIAGRHHDPFTAMQQFGRPFSLGLYSQPITDAIGTLLARVAGPVAAYNWLVLLSFPLSAATAYLLGRHLALSRAGAAVAALAYAFSPFHLAHAAYHPHIAQTQWIPLYLLALWRCLDRASPGAVALLAAAAATVTLSNLYGGFIAALITPVAACGYWLATSRRQPGSARRLAVTAGTLALVAGSGIAYAWWTAASLITSRGAFGFPFADLSRYSAHWWSYLVPPVAHPLLGAGAHRFWSAAGVREGLLEQQVTLGWGLVALALIALVRWGIAGRRLQEAPSLTRVPVAGVVALAALACSLPPAWTIGAFTMAGPSALVYELVPMFRSYARFGVVVQLMAALLAGIGVDCLRRGGTRRGHVVSLALVILAAAEYTVSPRALWRDVLPTRAHRWVMRQPGQVKALDCAALTQESASVQWLTRDRVTLLAGRTDDCLEPNLAQKLAAGGYTHVIIRRGTIESQMFDDHAPPPGFAVAARFADGRVFAVAAPAPPVYTAWMTGFFPREADAARSWRWMGAEAAWSIVNPGPRPIVATLCLELSANLSDRLDLRLDGRYLQTIVIEPSRRIYEVGPLAVGPGDHELLFQARTALTVPDEVAGNGDRRPLSFELGTWTWTVRSPHP